MTALGIDQEIAIASLAAFLLLGVLPYWLTNPPDISERRRLVRLLRRDSEALDGFFLGLSEHPPKGSEPFLSRTTTFVVLLFLSMAITLGLAALGVKAFPIYLGIIPCLGILSIIDLRLWAGLRLFTRKLNLAGEMPEADRRSVTGWYHALWFDMGAALNAGLSAINFALIYSKGGTESGIPGSEAIEIALVAVSIFAGFTIYGLWLVEAQVPPGLFHNFLMHEPAAIGAVEVRIKGGSGQATDAIAGSVVGLFATLDIRRADNAIEHIPWARVDWIVLVKPRHEEGNRPPEHSSKPFG